MASISGEVLCFSPCFYQQQQQQQQFRRSWRAQPTCLPALPRSLSFCRFWFIGLLCSYHERISKRSTISQLLFLLLLIQCPTVVSTATCRHWLSLSCYPDSLVGWLRRRGWVDPASITQQQLLPTQVSSRMRHVTKANTLLPHVFPHPPCLDVSGEVSPEVVAAAVAVMAAIQIVLA